jgi:hypothetical protein
MTRREFLLAALRRAWADASSVAAEARAIHRALSRGWITDELAAEWTLQAGILTAPPIAPQPDHWATAALAYRRDKYGAGGILEQGLA